jgi:hypothetical protein
MKPVFVIAIAATLFTACKNNKKGTDATDTGTNTTNTTTTTNSTAAGQTWDAPTRAAFVTNCINESKTRMSEASATEYCNCMLDKIVTKYDSPAAANNMTITETQEMAKDCVK